MKRGKVLIIDSEEVVCKALSIILEDTGYETTTSLRGEEGLRLVKENIYDIAILNLNIPDMNGIALLKNLKEIDPNLVVIVITEQPFLRTEHEGLPYEVFDYIAKPFHSRDIQEVIEKAINYANMLRDGQKICDDLEKHIKEVGDEE